MKKEEVIHLGDGVYLYFDGYGFELRANHHETPTDRIYLEPKVADDLKQVILETMERINNEKRSNHSLE